MLNPKTQDMGSVNLKEIIPIYMPDDIIGRNSKIRDGSGEAFWLFL